MRYIQDRTAKTTYPQESTPQNTCQMNIGKLLQKKDKK
jgi:hypothetical protein